MSTINDLQRFRKDAISEISKVLIRKFKRFKIGESYYDFDGCLTDMQTEENLITFKVCDYEYKIRFSLLMSQKCVAIHTYRRDGIVNIKDFKIIDDVNFKIIGNDEENRFPKYVNISTGYEATADIGVEHFGTVLTNELIDFESELIKKAAND